MTGGSMQGSKRSKLADSSQQAVQDTPSCFKQRRLFVMLSLFGTMIAYTMRVNLSMAILPMAAQFAWDDPTKGQILSMFFVGYTIGQIPGGWLATRFGGVRVIGIGIFLCSVTTLMFPAIVTGNLAGTGKTASLPAVYALRVAAGIFQSIQYPALYTLFPKWSPVAERAGMISAVSSGALLGTVLVFPISSALLHDGADHEGEWVLLFYGFGTAGVLWTLAWSVLMRSTPETSHLISDEEKAYIVANRGDRGRRSVETKQSVTAISDRVAKAGKSRRCCCQPADAKLAVGLMCTPAVWGIYVGHFVLSWILYTLITWTPSFMKDQLQFDISSTGLLTALPYACNFIVLLFAGFLADYTIKSGCLSVRRSRIFFTALALCVPGACLVAVGFQTDVTAAVALMTAANAFSGFASCGPDSNVLDVIPANAGLFYGVTNTLSSGAGVISPFLTGAILGKNPTAANWQVVFYITASLCVISTLVFGLLIKSKPIPALNGGIGANLDDEEDDDSESYSSVRDGGSISFAQV